MKLMKFFTAAALLASTTLQAQTTPKWLRYAAISPDGTTIAFTYKGDIYTVPASGGNATLLTMHEAHDFMPVWSRDGKQLAFASDRYGNFDVFVIAANGGTAQRITYHSTNEYPYDFTPDGKAVVFGAARGDAANSRLYPTGYMPELYQVAVTGGRPKQLLGTPAEDVRFNSNGTQWIYHDKKGQENAWRKHQTSSVARDIWLYDAASGKHTKLTQFAGEDRTPVFADGDKSIYYLSEASGSFNVYKMAANGSNPQQVTKFKKHPVRFLTAANNGTLCFSYDGELYTMQPNGSPKKVSIQVIADAHSNSEQLVRVNSGGSIAVSPNGKEVAFIFRGEVFVNSIEGGFTKRITNTPEQEVGVQFAPDGQSLIYASERNNKWSIYETKRVRKEEAYFFNATLLKETPVLDNANDNTQPVYSNNGKELAYIENRNQLRILNLATKKSRTILSTAHIFAWTENDQYFQWSPDDQWLLFDYAVPGSAVGEVGLVRADGSNIVNLTESGFNDYRPRWAMGGKAMIWLSNRDGLRGAAMSGGSQSDAYAMFFTQEAWDKFKLTKDEATLTKELEEKQAKADTTKNKKATKDTVIIDWEGLAQRKSKLTIHSSSMGDALVSKDGETLYYLARFERGMNLWTTNLRTRETKMLVPLNAGFASMVWDKEQKNIFISTDGSIIKLDPTSTKQDRVAINGEMMVDVTKERQAMLDHVWRRTKKTFYTNTYHGADWDGLKPDYDAYISSIGNTYELAEMLSELLGELNVSHSGAAYSNFNPNGDVTASLGVIYDANYIGDGVRIEEVIKGGPLDKAGFNITAGTIIEAIDGETITANTDVAQYLNRKVGKQVLLALRQNDTRREIVVKPVSLGEENNLLYKRWVKRNADEVERLSKGTLGYVHIPGMSDGVFRTTYEEMMGKYFHKQAIVVDTRNNGGGDLVADLATFLSGKKFMDYTNDIRSNGYEPNFRWTKPSISLANEANYSDGHCYSFMVIDQQIGKLVGAPVPGTCSFAAWESLMDSGIRWGAPTVGVKANDGRYLENSQTQPDILVLNAPEQVVKGVDQQLEAAVKAMLQALTNK